MNSYLYDPKEPCPFPYRADVIANHKAENLAFEQFVYIQNDYGMVNHTPFEIVYDFIEDKLYIFNSADSHHRTTHYYGSILSLIGLREDELQNFRPAKADTNINQTRLRMIIFKFILKTLQHHEYKSLKVLDMNDDRKLDKDDLRAENFTLRFEDEGDYARFKFMFLEYLN